MARGNWRNWERLEVKRPVECLWCGHRWGSVVLKDPVCPKCHMTNELAKNVRENPKLETLLSPKTRAMKGRFK